GGEDVLQRLHGGVGVLGELHADEVLVAALGVDPEVAVDRHAGVHGGDDLHDDLAGRQADLGRLLPVHIDDQVRRGEALGDADVGGPLDLGGLALDPAGQLVGLLAAAALDADVDGRADAVVQGRRDHAAGVEADAQVRESAVLGEGVPQL